MTHHPLINYASRKAKAEVTNNVLSEAVLVFFFHVPPKTGNQLRPKRVPAGADSIYGLSLCRGDVTPEDCRNCVKLTTENIIQLCTYQKEAIIWYDHCMLRYSNRSFFGDVEMSPEFLMYNIQNRSELEKPDISAEYLINGLVKIASKSSRFFEADDYNPQLSETRYGLVQCSRDLRGDGCDKCLNTLLTQIDDEVKRKRGWRILAPSCNLRYEGYLFYRPRNALTPEAPAAVGERIPEPPDQTTKGGEVIYIN
uniref:Gnk2-homologous domain-containing protein n=1 Tax=Nelumbo nucifera TaxID=4432 RepID=A0A822Z299_NELNU|nr:TPA_asm: hypothetical protein HUJ06_008196 [Nelumbo nucifera]